MTAPQTSTTPTSGRTLGSRDLLVLTFLGGTAGTLARWTLAELLGEAGGLGPGVVLANLLGALGMGVLVGRLPVLEMSAVRRQRLRALLGTGFLGGFTTYSALAVHCADLVRASDLDRAVLHGLGSVVLGILAAGIGLGIGAAASDRGEAHRAGDGPEVHGG